jgi:hypothetical protein
MGVPDPVLGLGQMAIDFGRQELADRAIGGSLG